MTATVFALTVSAPSIAPAQQSVVDSVAIGTSAPGSRTVVVVRAANVSFAVTPHTKSEVSAVLRSPRGRSSSTNQEGVLRAAATGDTVRIELARSLDALYHLDLGVPAGAAVRIAGDNGGEVRVEGVRGSVEITHSNGGVTVLDASGYVLVATSNGSIRVRILAVERGVPMSFMTNNGDIDLTVPADVRATLLIDDSIALQSELPLVISGRSRLRRIDVNGGGPTIRLFTNNGIVRLRRL